ncbi:NifB/NifX family molybdenum-iron cluster-binding protein [Oleidesulfovibrio sp.]|uniref:NifB/NifX family molybdenum-iron cluster-binding protein n=1 Tax=Oleidesulfovibrio sp. TaxID=2909707 RepID=UPI003A8BEA82
MIIAVAADGAQMSAKVEPVFGRADWYILVSVEDMQFEAIQNPFRDEREKAGRKVAALLHERGTQAVLCGDCGSKAKLALAEAGIRVGIGFEGPVKAAVEKFLSLDDTLLG